MSEINDQNDQAASAEEVAPPVEPPADRASADDLGSLREKAARNYAGWQRAQADYENLKRRSTQEVRDRVQQSQRAILLDLLDLADDFERANIESPPDEVAANDPWRQGIAQISQKLTALLQRQQVKQIDTVGQQFDPEFHEAVGQLPGQHDEIVAVLRAGYMVGARVLRASQVMVGDGSMAAPELDASDDASSTDDTAFTP